MGRALEFIIVYYVCNYYVVVVVVWVQVRSPVDRLYDDFTYAPGTVYPGTVEGVKF